MAETRALLSATPDLGARSPNGAACSCAGCCFPRTQNHLYYEVDEKNRLVTILAVWGAPRGSGPKL